MIDEKTIKELNESIGHARNTIFYSEKIPKKVVMASYEDGKMAPLTAPKDFSISSYEDFKLIPITESRDIAERHKDFVNNKAKHWRTFATSGTTGKPKFFHYGEEYKNSLKGWDSLLKYWGFENPQNEFVCIMFNMDGLAAAGPVTARTLEESGIPYITLGVVPPMNVISEILKEMKPSVLLVYPSNFMDVTNKLKDLINIKEIGVKLIISSGELLTEKTRTYFEEMWGVKVYGWFGACDVGGIGFECKNKDGFHLLPSLFYEVLDSDNNSRMEGEGELIITTLKNSRMPLLRYNLKDFVKISYDKCECGMPFPKMKFIKRVTDDFIIKGGIKIGAEYFEFILASFPEVTNNWQLIISEKQGQESIEIVIESNIKSEELAKRIKDEILKNSHNISKAIERGTLSEPIISLVGIGKLERKTGKIKRINDMRKV